MSVALCKLRYGTFVHKIGPFSDAASSYMFSRAHQQDVVRQVFDAFPSVTPTLPNFHPFADISPPSSAPCFLFESLLCAHAITDAVVDQEMWKYSGKRTVGMLLRLRLLS